MAAAYKPNQLVELSDGRIGWIRFIGDTGFSDGQWIGVELDEPTGKNDGAVQGERYFDCEAGHGLFVRPTGVMSVLEEPAPASASAPEPPRSPVKAPANGGPMGPPPPKARPSGVGVAGNARPRASLAPSVSKRMSLAGTPANSALANKRVSMAPTPTTSAAERRQSSVRPAVAAARPSMAPPSSSTNARGTAARKSVGGPGVGGLRPSAAGIAARQPARQSLAPGSTPGSRVLSPSVASATGSSSPVKSPTSPIRRPPATISPSVSSRATSSTAVPQVLIPTTAAPPSSSRPSAALQKTIDDLEAKIRVLEKKRAEDRERLMTLEKITDERDRFEMIIKKLQDKYQPQQQENADLKRQLKDSEDKSDQYEGILAEHDSVMEMATLDREMAEEKADGYRAELEAVKARAEELELENEILKEENTELAKDMSPEELTSKGWIQMERENGRLKEALFRLRDMSQEQESQLRHEIQSLEEDVKDFTTVKAQFEDQRAKLLEYESDIDDLKEQLETALGADELVEQLTERNMALGEQLEQLRADNQDLQALTELNDEIEMNHVEHEKQLQNEIDFKESLVAESLRRAAQQEDALNDQEYTLRKFRDLVVNLQADLEDMRASKEITETEHQALDNRSRAMMDLNRQLQASATNTRVKTIEMELRKLEAQEAAEHLAIVQLFLPDTFHAERDSVLALLRFKRVGFKAKLLHGFVRDKMAAQEGVDKAGAHVFAACDALDKLVWVSAMCDRFANSISSCSLEQFAKFEGALYEIEPVERTLNGYIDLVKKDELKEEQVAEGLSRSIAVMSHLGEIHLREGLESYANEVLMKTLFMQSQLESIAAALSNAKVAVLAALPHAVDDEDDGVNILAYSTEEMIADSRSAKVIVGKTVRALQDMKARSLALNPETLDSFEEGRVLSEKLAAYSRRLGKDVFDLLHEEGRAEPAGVGDVLTAMRRAADATLDTSEAEVFSTFAFRMKALTDRLKELHQLATDVDATTEFERSAAPWVLRSKELQDSKLVSVDAQEELARLKDDLRARVTDVKLRAQESEELKLKIEHLEGKMRDAVKKAERIAELERALEEGKIRAREVAELVERQARELRETQEERERLRAAAAEVKIADGAKGGFAAGEMSRASFREMENVKSEVKHLQAVNKYLHEVARRKQIEEEARDRAWLEMPLLPTREAKEQAATLKQEGAEWLSRLMRLPDQASPVRLELPEKGQRLKWQPMSKTAQWQLSKQELLAMDSWPAVKKSRRVEIV